MSLSMVEALRAFATPIRVMRPILSSRALEMIRSSVMRFAFGSKVATSPTCTLVRASVLSVAAMSIQRSSGERGLPASFSF